MRASRSRSSSFGVVPEEISAWKPEIAPHAIVMNANGKSLPAKTGPVPSMNRVSAGICSGGSDDEDPDRQRDHDADLHERREVVARREQQPHRQHRRREAVGHDEDGERLARSA